LDFFDIAGEDYHSRICHRCANSCDKTECCRLMAVQLREVNKQYFKSRNIGVYAKHWGWTIPASAQGEDFRFWDEKTLEN